MAPDADADADGGTEDGGGGGDADDGGADDGGEIGDGDLDGDVQDDAQPAFEFDRDRIFEDVAWLASPERAGRAPGTEGNEASMDYVEDLFAELGLQPAGDDDSFRQGFAFEQWVSDPDPQVVFDGDELEYGTDYFVIAYSGHRLQ